MIATSEKDEIAVGLIFDEIARAIEPRSGFVAERVRDETFGGQPPGRFR